MDTASLRKIYIARRIVLNTFDDVFVEIGPSASADDLISLYKHKKVVRERYVHNGHWILRPVDTDGLLVENRLPNDLQPQHIMQMVLEKLNDSDALIAFVNGKAYGTVVEIGYTVGTGRHAVYVLPEDDITKEELLDLWMSFYFALKTLHLWQDRDIQALPEFAHHNIFTTGDYKKYILSIIPTFLK